MITFTWKTIQYESGNEYIEWSAVWDGRLDNDELIKDSADWSDWHPFLGTCDYEQSTHMYKHFSGLSEEEKQKDLIIKCTDGTDFNMGNSADVNAEDYNPVNLRKCGDIVADNPVTRALCEMLSNPKTLDTFSGNVHPASYRNKLLCALSTLWD